MRYLVLLVFIFCVAAPSFSQDGLVTWWKMDDFCELKDYTSSPANGVVIDGSIQLVPNKNGDINSAMKLPTTANIVLGFVEKLKFMSDRSFSFWINPTINPVESTIFSFGPNVIQIFTDGTDVKIKAKMVNATGSTSTVVSPLVKNIWQNVVVIFDESNSSSQSETSIYVNSYFIEKKTTGRNQNLSLYNSPVKFLSIPGVLLDEFKIFNKVLTVEEVGALPTKLEKFNGREVDGVIELSWKTVTETNVSHFEIEKSTDGVNYTKIGDVAAGKFIYSYTDKITTSITSFVYYRLRTINHDGKFEFSPVVKIAVEIEKPFVILPNPAAGFINVGAINRHMLILNSVGQVVLRPRETGKAIINITDLQPGLYFVVIMEGQKRKVSKFIKR